MTRGRLARVVVACALAAGACSRDEARPPAAVSQGEAMKKGEAPGGAAPPRDPAPPAQPAPGEPPPPPASEPTGGRLPPEVIRRVVQASAGKMRACYERGRSKNRELAGRIATRVVIGADGRVVSAAEVHDAPGPPSNDARFPDSDVERCVVAAFRDLKFPSPEGGPVTVVYPLSFSPSGE